MEERKRKESQRKDSLVGESGDIYGKLQEI